MQRPDPKKRIAYIELDTHAEIASYVYELSKEFQKTDIDFYFSPKITSRQIDMKAKVVESFPQLRKELTQQSYDLIILGTVHRHFDEYLKLVRQFKTAVVVHNKNFTQASPVALLRGIWQKDQAFRLKLMLKEGLLSSGKVYREAAVRLVLDHGLADNHHKLLPIVYQGECLAKKSSGHIIIPGAVENYRRNYPHVLDILEETEQPLAITFLGKANHEMVSQIKNLQQRKPNLQLKWFEEKIPAATFGQLLCQASVLWCPVRRGTAFLGIEEIYGKTKVSGNIFDAAKAGTWALFPKNYPVNYPFLVSEEREPLAQIQKLSQTSPDFSGYRRNETAAKLEALLQQL